MGLGEARGVSERRYLLEPWSNRHQMGVDRLFLIEQKYTLTIVEAKVLFMQQLIQEINDGTLTEASANQRVWKITRPDLAQLGSEPEGEQVDKQTE
jgi:hypothetical protein